MPLKCGSQKTALSCIMHIRMYINIVIEFFDGSVSRLVIGSTIIVYLLIYNEASGAAILFATILAALYAIMAAYCKSTLRSVQMPYIRATNKFDFSCLFLATWMDVLAILCACAVLARTLSTCLDAMTGGMAHILILGRNSSANEPWPDVLGVAVVLLITCMCMLGLENSKAFCVLMIAGIIIMNISLALVTTWRLHSLEFNRFFFRPNGIKSVLTAAALLTFSYPRHYPAYDSCFLRYSGLIHIVKCVLTLGLGALCFTVLVHFKAPPEYIAIPVFKFLDDLNMHQLVPAAACLLMLTYTGAYMELFPELYGLIVRFATAEWKVFSKQISYESPDSGNPVLAIFISGSLCAMLAFACPLQILTHMLAGSHICAGILRAFYLLYSPYRPKYIQPNTTHSSLSYSRLATAPPLVVKSSSSNSRIKRNILSASLAKKGAIMKPKLKKKPKKELEKEWLLLGEPTSPCPARTPKDVESALLADREPPPSDFEYPEKFEKSDSDTSTDIDAIVDEYRQKIKVTTAGPMEMSVRLPTLKSWRIIMFSIFTIVSFVVCVNISSAVEHPYTFLIYIAGCIIISSIMSLFPSYRNGAVNVNPLLCTTTIMLGGILLSGCSYYSWPAILFWLIAGLALMLRCDNWCCGCFEYSGGTIQEQLIPNVPPKTATKATTVHIPHLPKRVVTIPTRVNAAAR
ncbi:probable cationic amino acid transporter isoform X1 [Rhagoletis pomonella]|uniref:probable cationic amino acid transporter isoform X1 n=1 Tax=Rhagoletis pomonella TaxID=28610 RepID=UPI001786D605|nr:probable cationic amino acid transporter isoform X1 [Rhagoletis pomonella]